MNKVIVVLLLLLHTLIITHKTAYADITSNLTNYWAFDENTGTSANDQGSANADGTLESGATWLAPGKIGASALSLDGSDDYVSTSSNTGYGHTSALSICLWANASSSVTGMMLIGTGIEGGTFEGIWFAWDNSDVLKFFFITSLSALKGQQTTATFSFNTWHHFCVTYDGSENVSNIKLYTNGSLASMSPIDSGSWGSFTDRPWRIGTDSFVVPADFFTGSLDEIKVWARELSSSDISEEYSRSEPIVKKRVIIY